MLEARPAKARLELVHLAGRRYGDVDDVGEQRQERLELGRALADRPPQLTRDDLVGSVVGEPEEHAKDSAERQVRRRAAVLLARHAERAEGPPVDGLRYEARTCRCRARR